MPANRIHTNATEHSAECSVPDSSPATDQTQEVTAGQPGGCCHCLPLAKHHLSFKSESLERLYQNYFRRQRQENLLVLGAFAALFNSYVIVMCAVVYTADKLAMVVVAAAGLAVDVAFFLACRLQKLPASAVSRGAVPYALWLAVAVHVLCYTGLNYELFSHASDAVGWQAFFSFSSFLALPMDLVPLLLLTALSCGVHTLVLGVTVAQRFEENLQGSMLVRQVQHAVDSVVKLLCMKVTNRGLIFSISHVALLYTK